jgi:hypothetical protein
VALTVDEQYLTLSHEDSKIIIGDARVQFVQFTGSVAVRCAMPSFDTAV